MKSWLKNCWWCLRKDFAKSSKIKLFVNLILLCANVVAWCSSFFHCQRLCHQSYMVPRWFIVVSPACCCWNFHGWHSLVRLEILKIRRYLSIVFIWCGCKTDTSVKIIRLHGCVFTIFLLLFIFPLNSGSVGSFFSTTVKMFEFSRAISSAFAESSKRKTRTNFTVPVHRNRSHKIIVTV